MTADVQLATRGTTSPKTGSRPLLEVKNLSTQFFTQDGIVRAVDDVSFYVMPGETLGVVGESGCGKSVTGLSIMRLIPSPPGKIVQGDIVFNGNDILQMSDDDIRKIRGHEIAMIFQDPMTSLNPVLTINRQLSEVLQLHLGMNQAQAKTQSIELLKIVGIPNPEERVDQYPHQFSGGMRQRVMIAIALSCNPKLIIADEPTTALDVTVQAQILDLMRTLQSERDTGVILITHSMGVVAGMADRVQVMYAGHIVEAAETEEIFGNPRHPYTVGLMKSIPGLDSAQKEKLEPIRGLPPDLIDLPDMCPFLTRCNFAREQCEQKRPPLLQVAQGHFSACWFWEEVSKESYASIAVGMQDRAEVPVASQGGGQLMTGTTAAETPATPGDGSGDALLTVNNLIMHFPVTQGIIFQRQVGAVHAVDDVSFEIKPGETLGLVGESGCGKSTIGRAILQLYSPTSGEVIFKGKDLTKLDNGDMRRMRRHLQIIFQDPYASLNPRMTVGNIISEPMQIHNLVAKKERSQRIQELLQTVGLNPYFASRYPHEFSGGERQRIGIARALAANPDFVVADEPVSALDVSIQAQIVNLLENLQEQFGLTYLFIAHDLSVVKHISDRVAVMYLGKIVEMAGCNELYADPLHPYTKALLSAVPIPDPPVEKGRERIILTGDVPSPINPPRGCRFHTRCAYVMNVCKQIDPQFADQGGGHFVACHLYPGSGA